MDAQAKKKALFRAKLNARKQEKQRIDSPIVRYNEHDQPICRVCDVVIKNESLWPAHQSSRKHHEAVDRIKANAAALNRPTNTKPAEEFPKPRIESAIKLNDKSESSLPNHRSSTLPPDFFDNHEAKKQKKGGEFEESSAAPIQMRSIELQTQKDFSQVSKNTSGSEAKQGKGALPEGFFDDQVELQTQKDFSQESKNTSGSEAKQVKGALPEGFFDDKDADLRARGITPIKPDVKDEYKEFEKLIQEDLQVVDNRLEEEEFDAAEMIEEEEAVEQRSYVERVAMLRRKKSELRAAKSAKKPEANSTRRKHKSSSTDDEDEDSDPENFKVDWRAKHL